MHAGTSNSIYEYDLAHNPLSFEFLVWLIHAEMARRRHGAGPLRIRFANAEEHDLEYYLHNQFHPGDWVNNVFRPLLPMIGAVEDNEDTEVAIKPLFLSVEILLFEIAEAAKWGEEVPRLRAPDHAHTLMDAWLGEKGRTPIVITLRETTYWPHRNSNLEAWKKFATDLRGAGEDVIFVRDTAKGTEDFADFSTCAEASFHLDMRMALYEHAKMNFFVSNGPVGMALFSRVPYCYFMTQYPGAQAPRWPWAAENQRTVCAVDSYENLSAEWKKIRR